MVWKASELYQDRSTALERGYVLADKAYEIDPHVISPYKDLVASSTTYTEFSFKHVQVRLWIEQCTCTYAESNFKQI